MSTFTTAAATTSAEAVPGPLHTGALPAGLRLS